MTLTIGQMSDTNEDNWASVKDTETDKCMHNRGKDAIRDANANAQDARDFAKRG